MLRVIELSRPPLAEGIHVCDAQYQGQRVQVRVRPSDLDAHIVILGAAGTGKSLLQEHLFRECARSGMGGIYIDQYGFTAQRLLATLSECLVDVAYVEVVRHPGSDVAAAKEQAAQAMRQILAKHRLVLVNLNEPAVGTRVSTDAARTVEETLRQVRREGNLTEFVEIVDAAVAHTVCDNPHLPTILSGHSPDRSPEWTRTTLPGVVLREHPSVGAECVQLLGGHGLLSEEDLYDVPQLTGYANLRVNRTRTGPFTCWVPAPSAISGLSLPNPEHVVADRGYRLALP